MKAAKYSCLLWK